MLAANDLHQPRGKSAAAQDVVHHLEPVKIRIRALDAAGTHDDVGLHHVSIDQFHVESGGHVDRRRRVLRCDRARQARQCFLK